LPSFEIAPPAGGDSVEPAAVCHFSGYLVGYSWDSFDPTSYGDIYGRMLLQRVVNPEVSLLLLDD